MVGKTNTGTVGRDIENVPIAIGNGERATGFFFALERLVGFGVEVSSRSKG